jgi:hypothetical protein
MGVTAIAHLVVFGAIASAVYILFALVRPLICCPGCKGTRSVARGRRRSPCPMCRATGRVRLPGATLIHRQLHEHLGPRLRDWFDRRSGGDS